MAKKAYLKVEQLAHVAQGVNSPVSYGLSRFTVVLCLDGESKWLLGRCPDLSPYSNYESLYCIYLPSIYLTRTLAVIHSSKTVYNDIHVIQCHSDKQKLVDSVTKLPFTQKPLRNGDRFEIAGLSVYRFKYIYIEDKEPSGDLGNDTIY